jgi:(p)ppGpp synthase/HD superfamily hydrolase
MSAFRVAAAAHRGQRRRSGDPVLRHCFETALILSELGMDAAVVATGLLHDVLDDTAVGAGELRRAAGEEVCGLVQGVSRLSLVSQMSRHSDRDLAAAEMQSLRAMLIAMADARVVIVKLADRLHNLRTLHALEPAKARRMAEESLAVYVPLASRLGIWGLKSKLEDACFGYLQPEEHARLSGALEEEAERAAITGRD